MWINGRRATRPDRDYYRNVRRRQLRKMSSSRRFQFVTIATAAVALVGVVIWLLLK